MDSSEIIDPFHRDLHKVLTEDVARRTDALAQGSAAHIVGGAQTVAELYAAQVSYIRALNEILAVCVQLEADRYGVRKASNGE